MYRDDPAWRGYMGVLESLYANHPVSVDIAGTVESIQDITADDLRTRPAPPHVPQVVGLVPGLAPEPEQVLQRTDVGTSISAVLPSNASSRVISILY